MVGVDQLVDRWLVEPDVAGSSPVVHPNFCGGRMAVTDTWDCNSVSGVPDLQSEFREVDPPSSTRPDSSVWQSTCLVNRMSPVRCRLGARAKMFSRRTVI
jgi:hypothetical protein